MQVVALVADLIFESKITATAAAIGADVRAVRTVDRALENLGGAAGLIVDLNVPGADTLSLIRTVKAAYSKLRVLAFLSHVQVELANQARTAGAEVLSRSDFTQNLPTILVELARETSKKSPAGPESDLVGSPQTE